MTISCCRSYQSVIHFGVLLLVHVVYAGMDRDHKHAVNMGRDIKYGLSVHKIGNGRGPVIPKEWHEKLDINDDDLVNAEVDFDDRTITYHV